MKYSQAFAFILMLTFVLFLTRCTATRAEETADDTINWVQSNRGIEKIEIRGQTGGGERSFEIELKDNLMMNNEVTVKQYWRFLAAEGYLKQEYWSPEGWEWLKETGRDAPDRWREQWPYHLRWPVTGVTYYEAEAFANWKGGRLPTEVEWESALRGLQDRTYPWGDDWEVGRCNSGDLNLLEPTEVGSYPEYSTPEGINDLLGNVWEWTSEVIENYPDYPLPQGYYNGMHVLRGGSFQTREWEGKNILPTIRHFAEPTYSAPDGGFRVVKDLDQRDNVGDEKEAEK